MTDPALTPDKIDAATDRLVKRSELVETLKLSSETIRLWMKKGTLPRPDVYPNRKTMAWKHSTLVAAGFRIP